MRTVKVLFLALCVLAFFHADVTAQNGEGDIQIHSLNSGGSPPCPGDLVSSYALAYIKSPPSTSNFFMLNLKVFEAEEDTNNFSLIASTFTTKTLVAGETANESNLELNLSVQTRTGYYYLFQWELTAGTESLDIESAVLWPCITGGD